MQYVIRVKSQNARCSMVTCTSNPDFKIMLIIGVESPVEKPYNFRKRFSAKVLFFFKQNFVRLLWL